MAETLLLVDSDFRTRKVNQEVLVQAGYRVLVADDALTALQLAREENPDVVLLELALPELDGIEVCFRLRQNPRAVHQVVIVLTTRSQLEYKLAALRAGADEYLVKPVDPREIVARVAAILARVRRLRGSALRLDGKLITFFSAKGGIGTTSVCVNTAAAMSRLNVSPLAVVDLVLPLGSVPYLTGVEPKATVAGLCRLEARDITQGHVDEHLFSRPDLGFSILSVALGPKESQEVLPGHIEPVFKFLRDMHAYTLVDVGRTMSRISLPVIEMSERVVVVLSPDRTTLLMTETCLSFFDDLQIPREKLVLVLSAAVGRDGMSKQEVEDYLQMPIFGLIPYQGDKFTVAASQGIPLVHKEPECVATQQFLSLAHHLLARKPA